MRRRALLSAVTAGTVGLAGCSLSWGPDDGEAAGPPATDGSTADADGTTAAPGATGTPGDDDRGLQAGPSTPAETTPVVDLATGPRTLAVRPAGLRHAGRAHMSFGFRRPDGEGPALLAVTVGNLRDHDVVLETRRLPTLGRAVARPPAPNDDPGLAFVPRGVNELARRQPDLERGPEGYWRLAEGAAAERPYPDRVRIAPGDRVRADCAVVGPPGTSGRPSGLYEAVGSGARLAVTVWHSERPGPTAPSRFGDRTVPPPFPDSERAVTWYHEAGPETPVYVVPEAERATLPTRVSFRAINHTAETLGCGEWGVFKLVDGTPYDLNPPGQSVGCRRLRPGERERWDLRAFGGTPVPGDESSGRTAGFLGGGTYAVVAGYGAETETSGALLDLEGPPVEVRPTDGVETRRDGDVVVVSVPFPEGDPEPGTATLTRAEDADRELVPEQVMRPWNRPVRNSVPFLFDDVDRVVVQTAVRYVEGTLASGVGTHRFTFEGTDYRLETEQLPRT